MRAGRLAATLLLALGLVVGACGAGDEAPRSDADSTTTSGAAAVQNEIFFGTVTDPDGAPVQHAALEIISQDGHAVPELAVVTGADGKYDGPPLQPGIYTINVTAEGFAKATKDATIEDGKPTQVDFQLGR